MRKLYVQVSRRYATFLEPYPQEELDDLTSFQPEGVHFMPAYNRFHRVNKIVDGEPREVLERVWDGKIRLTKNGVMTLGLFRSIRSELEARGYEVKVLNQSRLSQVWLDRSRLPKKLRDFQHEAFEAMAKNVSCGGLVLACTGSGKTLLSGSFFRAARNHRCLFVVDELQLMEQARRELQAVVGEKIGIVGEGVFSPQRVTVATTQTLDSRSKEPEFQHWFSKIRFVFVDELHCQMSRRTFKILENVPTAAFYGLTATLQMKKASVRLKAQSIAGPILYTYPLEQGVKDKILTPVVVVRIRIDNPSDPEETYAGQYRQYISHNRYRNDVVERLARLSHEFDLKVILLVDRVKHLKFMRKRLRDLNPQLVWGGRKKMERIDVTERFEAGEEDLIITNKVFKKGINIKSVNCGINAAALKSKDDAIQMLGRFVRKSKDKPFSVYFDLADYSNRFYRNAKSRLGEYQSHQVPILEIKDFDLESADEKWFGSILKRAGAAAEKWVESLQEV